MGSGNVKLISPHEQCVRRSIQGQSRAKAAPADSTSRHAMLLVVAYKLRMG